MPSRRAFGLALVVLVVGCEPPAPDRQSPNRSHDSPKRSEPKKLDLLTMKVPDGWTAQYVAERDQWQFAAPTPPTPPTPPTQVVFDRAASEAIAASPEALRHHLETKSWPAGTKAEIVHRESIIDGFATTFAVGGERTTYVVRQVYNEWFACIGTPIGDDAIRDQVVALCKSIKAPKKLPAPAR